MLFIIALFVFSFFATLSLPERWDVVSVAKYLGRGLLTFALFFAAQAVIERLLKRRRMAPQLQLPKPARWRY